MASKTDLQDWVVDALERCGGSARVVDVAREIWISHEADLRASGDLFYTWQYDMRWAAQRLRHEGRLAAVTSETRGFWSIIDDRDQTSISRLMRE